MDENFYLKQINIQLPANYRSVVYPFHVIIKSDLKIFIHFNSIQTGVCHH